MDFDVEHAAVLLFPDFRQPLHLGQELAVLDNAQPARTLGDEQAAIRQKREPPRRLDPSRDDLDLERLLLRLDDLIVGIGDVLRAALEGRGLRPDVGDELPDLLLGQRPLEGRHFRRRDAVRDVPGEALVVGAPAPLIVEEARRAAAGEGGAVAAGADLGEERCRGVAAAASAAPALRRCAALARLGHGGRRILRRGRLPVRDEALQSKDGRESHCRGRRGPAKGHARSRD